MQTLPVTYQRYLHSSLYTFFLKYISPPSPSHSHQWASANKAQLSPSILSNLIQDINQGNSQLKPFVYTSPAENSAALNVKGDVALWQQWNDLDLYPLLTTSTILSWWSDATLAIWNERLAKDPYQENCWNRPGRLYAFYISNIWSLMNYAAPAWYTLITELDLIQRTTTKNILSPNDSYECRLTLLNTQSFHKQHHGML